MLDFAYEFPRLNLVPFDNDVYCDTLKISSFQR